MPLDFINNALKTQLVQRSTYLVGFAIWTFLMWDRLTTSAYNPSSFGINYLALYTIPALILITQVLLNNQVFWALIFGGFTLALIALLYFIAADTIERSGNHVKAIVWNPTDVVVLVAFVGLMLAADWVIYRIRPSKVF